MLYELRDIILLLQEAQDQDTYVLSKIMALNSVAYHLNAYNCCLVIYINKIRRRGGGGEELHHHHLFFLRAKALNAERVHIHK